MKTCENVPELNLTSMIDLVFFLLIFFMAASSLSSRGDDSGGERIPVSSTAPEVADGPRRLVVEAAGEGRFRLEGRVYTGETLGGALRDAARGNACRVVVRGAEDVPFEEIRAVLRASASAGQPDVLFATRPVT